MKNEERQIGLFYGSHFVATNSGTTAMYLLFSLLGLQKKQVLFPAISCTSPVNAAIFAGYDVSFADVDAGTYTMDFQSAEKFLESGRIGVVVPTHIYGHHYDRERARYLADKYGVFLLEDAAQTVDVGRADASVVSFGHTKIFQASGGGDTHL